MAGRGITIDILANVRDALKGTGDVEEALADIESTLEDMARDGDKSVDKMSRGFRDLARDADNSADKIERSYKQAYKDAARAADSSADDARRAGSRMAEQSSEVGQEIRQNLGEGLANAARGDFESLGDLIGDTLGGVTAGIGGIGTAAAGAAGALGLGALIGAFTLANEKREELTEKANELAQAYIDAGSSVLDAMTIAARTSEIITGEERQQALDYAKALGVDLPTAARAMAGDLNALAVVNRIASEAQQENKDIADDQRESVSALTQAQRDQLVENQAAISAGRELNGIVEEANQKFEDQQAVLQGLINDADGATVKVDDLGNKLYELPDGTQIVVEAETGTASTNVDNFKGDLDEIDGKVVRSKVVFDVDDSRVRAWRPQVKAGVVQYGPKLGQLIWE